MHACSDYTIRLTGTEEELQKATAVLAAAFDDASLLGKDCIPIEETYRFVWVEDIAELARQVVKTVPALAGLTISGTVDTSESAGEYMDFYIQYEAGSLTVQSSCWYVILDAEEYADYEEFSEEFEDYSEEDFAELRQCPHYILDSGEGELVTKVPLGEKQEIPL